MNYERKVRMWGRGEAKYKGTIMRWRTWFGVRYVGALLIYRLGPGVLTIVESMGNEHEGNRKGQDGVVRVERMISTLK